MLLPVSGVETQELGDARASAGEALPKASDVVLDNFEHARVTVHAFIELAAIPLGRITLSDGLLDRVLDEGHIA